MVILAFTNIELWLELGSWKSDCFVAVAPSRIHRRGVSGAAAADFHHRNLNGFSSASASDSRSQLSASSPDSLDAASHNQSGDVDSGQNNNSGRSSGNYYYRKLQSNESPSRRRVVRHRARRNVPSPLASSSNGNENGGVVNGSVRSVLLKDHDLQRSAKEWPLALIA